MSVAAPPRPPRPSDPVDRDEVEALVEALIEEARQRARRRRRIYAASVTLVALVVVAVSTVVERATQPDTASPALAARSSGLAAAATSKIAFIREPLHMGYAGVLWVMNADGSEQRRLALAHPGMRWSPDGQKLALGEGAILVIDTDGSGQERLTSPVYNGADLRPAWSPDGRTIAFIRYQPSDESEELWVMNADGSGQRRLARNAWHETPAWSPDGRRIAFVGRRGHKSGSYHSGSSELDVMNADGSGRRRLTRNTVRDSNPVWSPDGRRIAFESSWQVNVMNADGSGQRRLTHNGGRNFAPAWSPDGQRIAFERRLGRKKYGRCSGCGKASTFEVHVMDADGSGQQRLTTQGAEPGWSPDGQKIAFMSERDGNAEIYVMNADGSGQRNLTRTRNRHESGLVWSPAQTK